MPKPLETPQPTTKQKQRVFLDALLFDLQMGLLDRVEIIKRLRVLRRQLHNRPPIKLSGPISTPLTPTTIKTIRRLHAIYPDMAHQAIAAMLNTNIGRVSEVLAGKRT